MNTTSTDTLRINGQRLWDSLMDMARFGATPAGGVHRLALSPADIACRAHFRALCEAAGLAVRVDAAGNMFARRPGRDPTRAPVLFGSHLDSQPFGGRFDGALGVMAGLEVMRSLNDNDTETEAPLELVNWTDEEGSRFGVGLIGSGLWAGVHDPTRMAALTDAEGVSLRAALDAAVIGGGLETVADVPAPDAYFELHIEQGPVLDRAGETIGIVTGAQAQLWYDVVVTGTAAHAGTTPPSARRDALVCAARVIDLVDRMMRARGENGRGTVGQLRVLPNSRNVIPGEVRFSVEFRHPSDAEIERLAAQFPREAGFIARDSGTAIEVRPVLRLAAQPFDPACVALVREAAARLGLKAREMVSGAGHDAIQTARRAPTAMIFVPCKDGLSHNEAESIEPGEAEAGAQVLLQAVLARANRPI
jgi:beta-ureidopropionase / N-carbamoyl-L-amino-acid hydrolase